MNNPRGELHLEIITKLRLLEDIFEHRINGRNMLYPINILVVPIY